MFLFYYINNTKKKTIFLLSWKQIFRPFLTFREHKSKSIQDIPTKVAAHIKQVALMCHLIFSEFFQKLKQYYL